MVPTIGILEQVGNLEGSGKIITMTDSDCIDSNSVYYTENQFVPDSAKGDSDSSEPGLSSKQKKQILPRKCFWLMQKFADLATGKMDQDVLLNDSYKLPSDFLSEQYDPNSLNQIYDVKSQTLEQFNQRGRQSMQEQLPKKVRLNSDDQSCRNTELFEKHQAQFYDLAYAAHQGVQPAASPPTLSVWNHGPVLRFRGPQLDLSLPPSQGLIAISDSGESSDFNKLTLQNFIEGDEVEPKIIIAVSFLLCFVLLCFCLLAGFNFLVLHSPRLKNFIFKHACLRPLQWMVIKKDTSPNFAMGI
mmetsp:Transcript_1704/g.3007  ORF Transcript_1704/g.3007 Transcript_1704/m.3007 type:complete len:301 (-) Transcript_1704:223-1125(-)